MATLEVRPGGYVIGVPLMLMGSLDAASAVYAYWMLRIAVDGPEAYWASFRDDGPLPLSAAVRRGGVSARSLAAALSPLVAAHYRGVRGTDAFDAALHGARQGLPVLVRLPPASAVYPEGHHLVVRGFCRIVGSGYEDDQLIVNDPAIGERFLSREELRACRSLARRPFHVFVGREPWRDRTRLPPDPLRRVDRPV